MKNYAAASGYAYEYYFEGYRDALESREYVFSLSGDRKTWRQISLHLPMGALHSWQRSHGRELADNERYAIAKTALFEAFNTVESPPEFPTSLTVTEMQVEELTSSLGLD